MGEEKSVCVSVKERVVATGKCPQILEISLKE